MANIHRRARSVSSRQWLGLLVFEAAGVLGTIGAAHDAAASLRKLDALAFALVVVAIAAAALTRLAPTVACLLVVAAVVTYGASGYPDGPVFLALPVSLFRAVDVTRLDRSVALGVVAFTGQLLVSAATHSFGNLAQGVGSIAFALVWIAAPLVLGHLLATRRAYNASLAERARLAEQTREEEAQRRVTEERLRIARELHDVLAHTISVINVQAGMAAHVLDSQPEAARRAMVTVRDTSREALRELRNVLDVLREESSGAAPPPPAPGLAQLPALLATVNEAGLAVDMTQTGTDETLPAVVELAAYRIVQESLTNAIRHARASHAEVALTRTTHELRVVVSDDGSEAIVPDSGGGHGIAGMRERATSLGGTLEAAPSPGGGFRVVAILPVDRVAGT